MGKTYNDGVCVGMNMAWNCARKIVLNQISIPAVFDVNRDCPVDRIFEKYNAREALNKISNYEERKKEEYKNEIKVGDVVIFNGGFCREKGIVLGIDRNRYYVRWEDGEIGSWDRTCLIKTESHYDLEDIYSQVGKECE